jgi:hypothetical protein
MPQRKHGYCHVIFISYSFVRLIINTIKVYITFHWRIINGIVDKIFKFFLGCNTM